MTTTNSIFSCFFTLSCALLVVSGCDSPHDNSLQKSASNKRILPSWNLSTEAASARIKLDVDWLADDARQGRGPHTPQLAEAARYIQDSLAKAGCSGIESDAPELQPFHSIASWSTTSESYLEFQHIESGQLLAGQAFRPLPWSGDSTFQLPLAFVGYGIQSSEPHYDDFDGVDVRGKAVIVLRHEPQLNDPRSPFEGRRLSQHGYLETKIRKAIDLGAVAVLVCNDRAHLSRTRRRGDESADTLLNFSKERERFSRVPILHVKRRWVADLVRQSLDVELDEIERKIDQDLRPRSAVLSGQTVGGHVAIESHEESLFNVLGLIPGRGNLADEYLIIGAHYDHLGRGQFGSLAPWTAEIHNGADDNASGTAAVLELARRLSQTSTSPQRSILFVLFSGEEMGLLGSQHYCRFPQVPLSKTVAMLNLDMVGRLDSHQRLEVFGVATSTDFEERLNKIASVKGVTLEKHPEGYGPSDHNSFFEVGIPVLHFFTGLHQQYHRPSDDADLVDISGIVEITELVGDLALQLATADRPPEFAPESQDLFSLIPDSLLQANATTPTERIGLTVREHQSGAGLQVISIRRGSPADQAQLRRGDLIESVNGQTVKNRQDWDGHLENGDSAFSLVIRRRQLRMKISLAF